MGGKYLFCMQAPQEQGGHIYYNTGVYTKIVPYERLEFTQSLSDAHGNPIDPADAGMPTDFPKEVKFVIEFKALGDARTELVITEHEWPNSPSSACNSRSISLPLALASLWFKVGRK